MADADGMVEYRDVQGFPGYRVGNDGSVWSRFRKVRGEHRGFKWVVSNDWRRLAIVFSGRSYKTAIVTLCRSSEHITTQVARLVLTTFVGPCPEGMECCHFPDPDPRNCNLSNLRWGTKSSNWNDKRAHGTATVGEKHPMARLTEINVVDIREQFSGGVSRELLAGQFCVSRETINCILSHRTWKSATGPRHASAHPASTKLTESIVSEIRRAGAQGESQRKIAKRFGVSQSQVGNILRCAQWKTKDKNEHKNC